jgi:predicted PurR-regulated permease PerM
MQIHSNIRVTGAALKRWFFAQCIDSLLVAAMWLVGLLILGVPWAPLWAVLAFGLQFIPQLGGPLTLIGPMFATLIAGHGWYGALYLLFLYAIVMVVDGLVLQPVLMRRAARVPLWASILVPLVMGFFFQFWGVLLSAPLLAVFYALRAHRKEQKRLPPRVEVIPPPAEGPVRRVHGEHPPVIEG